MPAGCISTRWTRLISPVARPSSPAATAACRSGAIGCSPSCTAMPRRRPGSFIFPATGWSNWARRWRSEMSGASSLQWMVYGRAPTLDTFWDEDLNLGRVAATAEAIAETETRLGIVVPAWLRTLYARYDGGAVRMARAE